MAEPTTLLTVLLAAALTLPARPAAVAVGDVDGDGAPELAVLLVWDDWGSRVRDVATAPGTSEIEVMPAIRERRELRVFDVAADALVPAAAPLPVGPELLALAASPLASGPVVALLDDGPARVLAEPGSQPDADAAIRLERLADVQPLMAGARRVFSNLELVHHPGLLGSGEISVPVAGGVELVAWDGSRASYPSSAVERASGALPFLRQTLPERIDLDRDGTLDLLDVTRDPPNAAVPVRWGSVVAAYRRGLGGGRVAPAVVWVLDDMLDGWSPATNPRITRRLVDVIDVDADGTLEAAVAVGERDGAASMGEALDQLRGPPGRLELHALLFGGQVERRPDAVIDYTGHLFPLARPGGLRTPFRDLDGDGVTELVTFTVAIGWMGAGRALATGRASARLHPEIHRRGSGGWSEVDGAVPALRFRQNLRDLDLSRFFDWPADLDGDGVVDLVEVDGDEVRVRLGVRGPRYLDEPSLTVPLTSPIRDWGGVRFLDADGDGDLDLLAFEPVEASAETLARGTTIELVWMDYSR